jgi:hypothetical protein
MPRLTMAGLIEEIRRAVSRGKGTFGIGHSTLGPPHKPFTLVLGSIRALTVDKELRHDQGGYVVTLGLTVEQVERLRDDCQTLLDEYRGPVPSSEGKPS